jgi:hypothetical protein
MYQTFQIKSPKATHFRPATCAEVECQAAEHGWRSTIDENTVLGQQQAFYIRKQSGRKFTEERNELGLTVFTFANGQECFAQHETRVQRPELYFVRGGDFRGNPTGERRQHQKAEHWVEEFAENQQRIIDAQERG